MGTHRKVRYTVRQIPPPEPMNSKERFDTFGQAINSLGGQMQKVQHAITVTFDEASAVADLKRVLEEMNRLGGPKP